MVNVVAVPEHRTSSGVLVRMREDAPKLRCLLIDPEEARARETASALRKRGWKIAWVAGVEAASALVVARTPDAILLDASLKRADYDAIRGWHERDIAPPTILIADAAEPYDRVRFLEAGLDAVVPKPFDAGELDARLRALIRMKSRVPATSGSLVRVGALELNFRLREARLAGELIPLSPRQFKLLAELADRRGSPVSRGELLQRVWNLNFDPQTKLLETQIFHVRRHLKQRGLDDIIETVRGGGYSLKVAA